MFYLIDDSLKLQLGHLRQRGPQPRLTDSELLTIELVGQYLGLCQDRAIFRYFSRHISHFFPTLPSLHRTTLLRQSANLWKVKEVLWQKLIEQSDCDTSFAIVDSFPVAVCKFARAPRSKNFRGFAAFGKDHTIKQTFYGFRFHARVCWPGVITRLMIAPANESDVATVEELVAQTRQCCCVSR
jgi:hypothetical protein